MRYAALFILVLFFISCKKSTTDLPATATPEAFYTVIVSVNWSSPSFTVPVDAHFTRLIGMVHAKDSFLWGQKATVGLEFLAEVGSNGRLNNEIDSIIAKQKALSRFGMNPPGITGNIDSTFKFTTGFSCFSFASMVAPSPDWFIAVNTINLLENNQWLLDKTVDLYVHDAGTEDGDIFGYDNPPTVPQQNIMVLTAANGSVLANGNPVLGKIGTIRFIKN